MPKDVEPFQPASGSPPYRAAGGCKVKAQAAKPHAFNSGEKPCLVTLRDHSSARFLGRIAGLAHGKSIVAEASPVRRPLSSESNAAYTAPLAGSGVHGSVWRTMRLRLARRLRVARDVFVTRSRQA